MKPATCHPDQPHFARSLCRRCYDTSRMRKWREANPDLDKANQRRWNSTHKDQIAIKSAAHYRLHRDAKLAKAKERYAAAPAEVRRSSVVRRYGMSAEAYQTLLGSQGGVCLLCKQSNGKRSLCVDHCHITGAVRALLCDPCNMAVGVLETRIGPDGCPGFFEYIAAALAVRGAA